MKKIKISTKVTEPLYTVTLEDFSLFEEKMTKIKYLKAVKQDLDRSFIEAAIEALALKGKKITAKRVKKICKRALTEMVREVER